MNLYTKGYYNEVAVMKAMAAFFITWFHFKWTVPESFANLFVGGAIGNSIFFYCSGYLLSFREEKFAGEWILKKVLRLMPSVWVFMLLAVSCDFFRDNSNGYAWYNWLYPTTYWFVNAILVFFVVMYFLEKFLIGKVNLVYKWGGVKWTFLYLGVMVVALYLLWYALFVPKSSQVFMDEGGLKCWPYYFSFFAWGYYTKLCGMAFSTRGWRVCCFPISVVLFFTYKKIAGNIEWVAQMQVVAIPLLLALIVCFARDFAAWIYAKRWPDTIKRVCVSMSNLTLDIYIVQIYLITWMMPQLPFPLNVFMLLLLIYFAAIVNKNLADKVGRLLLKYI